MIAVDMALYWWTIFLLAMAAIIVLLALWWITELIGILSYVLMWIARFCGTLVICVVFVQAVAGTPHFIEISGAHTVTLLVEGGTALRGTMDDVFPDGLDTYRITISGQTFQHVSKDMVVFDVTRENWSSD